jgi:hypothetical protein
MLTTLTPIDAFAAIHSAKVSTLSRQDALIARHRREMEAERQAEQQEKKDA